MKKVLLIGELNQTVKNINSYLTDYYDTQLCVDSLELVKGMIKVVNPHMAIVCLIGTGEVDSRILDYFSNEETNIPVLLVGTGEECRAYKEYYEKEQFDFVLRPTTQTVLLHKCKEILKTNGLEQEEELVTVQVYGKRKSILIVDDSALTLRSIKSILDKKYDVSVATSGEKAVTMAKKNPPDLILLDYEMPEWDGKKTLEKIRNEDTIMDTPVMFLTGVADKDHISAVLGLNPAGYLLKPVEQKKLLKTIGDLLKEW